MEFSIENVSMLLALLLLIGVIFAKFSSRLGVPSLILFIVAGMILNTYFFFDNAHITQFIGTIALIIILFEGGLQTKWSNVKSVYKPALSLATIGVLITTLSIGIAAKFILEVSWLEGMLFGAIVGSTDAAAVFSVLGNKNIKSRISSTLEAESGSNDPMAIFLTVAFLQLIQLPNLNPFNLVLSFFWQMGMGLVLGALFGMVSVWIINKINLDSSGLYPVLSVSLAILTYALTSIIDASGLLAVYVMAIIVGNRELTYRHSIIKFNEGFAWMLQIVMFILLGLLVFPQHLPGIALQGILLSVLLIFVARPLGVYISLAFDKSFSVKEKFFISWAGLKGAVPIVLATFPMVANLENSEIIFNVVFFVVLLSALVQGTTITPLANYFKLAGKDKPPLAHTLELVSIGKTNNEMIEVHINQDAYITGKAIKEIELPEKTLISAVIRRNDLLTPTGDTIIKAEDTLYVLANKSQRKNINQLLNAKKESLETEHGDSKKSGKTDVLSEHNMDTSPEESVTYSHENGKKLENPEQGNLQEYTNIDQTESKTGTDSQSESKS
ncbi:potassium/proton antiporter [Rossellomorea oryzaecorticis]|uniref:Potassium/proton antiporter n=1 Tax=Rossellomorea oryzaecorticis TaxID=1396505 RepID=A0ABU9KAN3_9BACI